MIAATVFVWLALGHAGAGALDAEDPSFVQLAKAALAKEDWAAIETLCRPRIDADPKDGVAYAWLSVSLARQQRFEDGEIALKEAAEHLGAATAVVPGLGSVLDEYGNALWSHCWANFDPQYNRRIWQGIRDSYGTSSWSRQASSRLLMAALKLGDDDAAAPLIAEFEALIEHEPEAALPTVIRQYTEGYLRAGQSTPRVRELAGRAFEIATARAEESAGYPPGGSSADDRPDDTLLAARERVDLDVDKEYNAVALANMLLGEEHTDQNPLTAREANPRVTFQDITEQVGLAGVRRGRVAVADFDDDGDPDLCFQGALFRNDDGRFVDATNELGLGPGGASALFGDPDNDGDLDLLLPAAPHPRLMRNVGPAAGHRFEDATTATGVDQIQVTSTPEGAAWVDLDRDGWLDFYLAAYEQPLAVGHQDRLARNQGDGTFKDASDAAGIAASAPCCGRGVTCSDYDDDGDPDLYVSNYRIQPNFLYRNDGGLHLEDVAPALSVQGIQQQGYYGHTIGSCFGDVDGDGDMDLFAANLAHPRFVKQGFSNLSMLYLNQGAAGGYTFLEARQARGIRFQETPSDPALVDVDNDGDLDLSITCVYEGVPSALYQNDGRGYFQPITFRSRMVTCNGWGQAWFDLDRDGDLDALIASGSGVRMFENQGNDHKWLRVHLRGKKNRFGIGARVTATALGPGAPPPIVRELVSARGTTSQDEPIVHFGLGEYKGKVRVTVRWPDTGEETRSTEFVNRTVTIQQR